MRTKPSLKKTQMYNPSLFITRENITYDDGENDHRPKRHNHRDNLNSDGSRLPERLLHHAGVSRRISGDGGFHQKPGGYVGEPRYDEDDGEGRDHAEDFERRRNRHDPGSDYARGDVEDGSGEGAVLLFGG